MRSFDLGAAAAARGSSRPYKPAAASSGFLSQQLFFTVPRPLPTPPCSVPWPFLSSRTFPIPPAFSYGSEPATWPLQNLTTSSAAFDAFFPLPVVLVQAFFSSGKWPFQPATWPLQNFTTRKSLQNLTTRKCFVWFRSCCFAPSNPPNAPDPPQRLHACAGRLAAVPQACGAGCTNPPHAPSPPQRLHACNPSNAPCRCKVFCMVLQLPFASRSGPKHLLRWLHSSCRPRPERPQKVFYGNPPQRLQACVPLCPALPERPRKVPKPFAARARRHAALPSLARKATKQVFASKHVPEGTPLCPALQRLHARNPSNAPCRCKVSCMVPQLPCATLKPSKRSKRAAAAPSICQKASCRAQACCAGCTLAAVQGQKGHKRCFIQFRSCRFAPTNPPNPPQRLQACARRHATLPSLA